MLTTSIETSKPGHDHSDSSDRCETCGALVDLTKKLRVKGNRITGCSDCNWGALRSSAK
jgi:ribosome-binding protein aMBF1 (putative translation factor)